jgi:amino acid transporter
MAVETSAGAAGRSDLVRAIGRWSLVALVINCIIGSGIFGLPSLIAGHLGRWAPLGYLVAGAGMAMIVACFAEVSSRFTEAGGPYLYARAAFGSFVAIQTGWLAWLVRLSASAASANLFVDYLGEFVPRSTAGLPRVLVLTLIVGALFVVNVRGVRGGARVSNVFTIAKLLPLLALIVSGAIFVLAHGWHAGGGGTRAASAVEAMLLLVFAYGGFESAVIPAGEARDPRRDTPFALFTALAVCSVVYMLIHLTVVAALPDPTGLPRPLAAAARATMGTPGAILVTAGALFSTYGLLSANILNVPRLTFALARKGEFPAVFGLAHPRYRTPHASIALFAFLVWALSVSGGFRWNAVLSAVARLFTYAVVCAAVPALRRKEPGQERFHLPGGTAFAAVGIAFCAIVASRMGQSELAIVLVTFSVATVTWLWSRGKNPYPAS